MYRIKITKESFKEYPEKDYHRINLQNGGACTHEYTQKCDCKKEYYETGKLLRQEFTDEIYEQGKEEIDLPAIIKAFNDLK